MQRIIILLLLAVTYSVHAKVLEVNLQTTHNNTAIGSIKFADSRYGLLIKPKLKFMNPGMHGFHVHVQADCSEHGMAAHGHFDPEKTGKHLGPYKQGHLGDLPAIYVDKSGQAKMEILAPRLKVDDLINHAIMIHAGGDNYSDKPLALGGGGERLACGVVK